MEDMPKNAAISKRFLKDWIAIQKSVSYNVFGYSNNTKPTILS